MAVQPTRRKSELAKFECVSPNCNKPRTGKIRRLTPHCVAGNLSIETTLGLSKFMTYNPTNGSSTGYAIGTDGRIGLGVEETNRAWTSSSPVNDHEAITFEIANNGGEPDWRMSDAAINAWLDLSVDIAKFYGYKKVNYQPKPANITFAQTETWIKTWSKADEMIVTLHNWFSAKACPGPYFMRQIPWLVGEMNKRLQDSKWKPEPFVGEGSSPKIVQSQPAVSKPQETKTRRVIAEKELWDEFKFRKLNDFAIAGIMGNLYAESGLKATNLQNSFEKSLGLTDETYTDSIDNGSYTNFVRDGAGYGLAQWTFWTRKEALLKFAQVAKTSIGDGWMQLDFLWSEMTITYNEMLRKLDKVATVYDASTIVLTEFERPADMSDAIKKKRAELSQVYMDKYGTIQKTSTPSTKPSTSFKEYLVTITVSAINIRKGPTVDSDVVETLINDKNVYTIVEEQTGKGSDGKPTTWGRLKSGIGWIGLAFTKKK